MNLPLAFLIFSSFVIKGDGSSDFYASIYYMHYLFIKATIDGHSAPQPYENPIARVMAGSKRCEEK